MHEHANGRNTPYRKLRLALLNVRASMSAVAAIDVNKKALRVVRYAIKCAIRPRASLAWIGAVYRSPLGEMIHQHPRLLLKPHRPYRSRRYGFAKRARAVLEHYELATGTMSASLANGILRGSKYIVAELAGKCGTEDYVLTLARTIRFDREGELCLSLQAAGFDAPVYRLVFSFAHDHDGPCIQIGCMQGSKGADAKGMIKQATKAMHGIRAKNLLVDALYALAAGWGIARICGISTAARIFQGSSVHSDYDAFWRELGGVPHHIDCYVLPRSPSHSADGVASKHRAEHGRRALLRERLAEQLRIWTVRCSADAGSRFDPACASASTNNAWGNADTVAGRLAPESGQYAMTPVQA